MPKITTITKLSNNKVEVTHSTSRRSYTLEPDKDVFEDEDSLGVTVVGDNAKQHRFKESEVLEVIRKDGTIIPITNNQTLYDELKLNFFFRVTGSGSGDGWSGRVDTRNDLPITVPPNTGSIYLVESPVTQTVLGIPYKTYQSGLYIRDSESGSLSDWRRLNVKVKFTDSQFHVVNSTDTGKQFRFSAESVTSGNIRTLTAQDKSYIIGDQSDIDNNTSDIQDLQFSFEEKSFDVTNDTLPVTGLSTTSYLLVNFSNFNADIDLTGNLPTNLKVGAKVVLRKTETNGFALIYNDGVINYDFAKKSGEFIRLTWTGTKYVI